MAANEALEACAAVSGAHLEQLPLDSAVPSVLDCLGARELGALSCTGSAVLRRAACAAAARLPAGRGSAGQRLP